MLSNTERKILTDLLKKINNLIDLSNEKNILEKEVKNQGIKGKKLKRKIEIAKEITIITNELLDYFNDFKTNYKRVLKHRIKKKVNRMMDDLILIHHTYEILGDLDKNMTIHNLFPIGKYAELKSALPSNIRRFFQNPVEIDKYQFEVDLLNKEIKININ